MRAFEMAGRARVAAARSSRVKVWILAIPGNADPEHRLGSCTCFSPWIGQARLARAFEQLGARDQPGTTRAPAQPACADPVSARRRRLADQAGERSCNGWRPASRTRRSPRSSVISLATARNHVHDILEKLGDHSKLEGRLARVPTGLGDELDPAGRREGDLDAVGASRCSTSRTCMGSTEGLGLHQRQPSTGTSTPRTSTKQFQVVVLQHSSRTVPASNGSRPAGQRERLRVGELESAVARISTSTRRKHLPAERARGVVPSAFPLPGPERRSADLLSRTTATRRATTERTRSQTVSKRQSFSSREDPPPRPLPSSF